MNHLGNPTFNFELFGIPAQCWMQNPSTVGWTLEDRNGAYNDMNGNSWSETSLEEFINTFASLYCGDLTIGDFLPKP